MGVGMIKDPNGSGRMVSPFQDETAGKVIRSMDRNGYPSVGNVAATLVGIYVLLGILFIGGLGLSILYMKFF